MWVPCLELMNSNLSQRFPQVSLTKLALEWVLGEVATQQRIRSRRFSNVGKAVVVVVLTVVVVVLTVVVVDVLVSTLVFSCSSSEVVSVANNWGFT